MEPEEVQHWQALLLAVTSVLLLNNVKKAEVGEAKAYWVGDNLIRIDLKVN